MAAFTKWKFMDLEGNIVLIPTLVVTSEDKDVGIAWLIWGVVIREKGD
jgi:hypothetical protein